MTDALEAAHTYVKAGYGIVPLYGVVDGVCACPTGAACPSAGKHPHGKGGSWNILTGGANVQAWYEDNPHDNLGIVTGPDSGIFVIDVDPENGGAASVVALTKEYGDLPPTWITKTGSGGWHYYYRVLSDTDVVDAPTWLLKLLAEHTERKERGHSAEIRVAEHVDVELLPERVATLARQHVGMDAGRFKHFHALVAATYEAGFTQGQAVTIAAPWCAAVGKFVGRVEQEVARTWGKLEAESQRANEWIDGLGDRPTMEESWTTTSAQPVEPAVATTAGAIVDGSPTPSPVTADGAGAETDLPPSTWAPVDPGPILAGTYEPPKADLLPRSDGHCLLYRGLVHSFHGESESGKSMIAQGAVARVLTEGGTAAYIDFESDARSVYGRLRDMSVPDDALTERFTYRHPDVEPFGMPTDRAAYAELAATNADIIIIDGVTDALGVFGAGTNDADEVSGVYRRFFRYVAGRTGAAVVLIDHVTKNADTRGRHAVGSQAKMNALDGAAYLIEVIDQPGQGRRGLLSMRVGKDRPGGIRGNGVSQKDGRTSKDRTEMAARVVIDSTGGPIEITVEAPDMTPPKELAEKRARGHMDHIKEDLCRYMLEAQIPWAQADAKRWGSSVGIGQQKAKDAFDELKLTKYFKADGKRGGQPVFVVAEPYSAASEWLESATSAPRRDLGSSSAAEVIDHLGSTPIPLGGAEVGTATEVLTSAESTAEVSAEVRAVPVTIVEVACKSCFRPIPETIANALGGICGPCSRKAGLA